MQRDQEELVLLLLRQGSTSDAVRLYQEETGACLDEASEAIEDLAGRFGVRRFAWPLIAIGLVLAALASGVAAAAVVGWRA